MQNNTHHACSNSHSNYALSSILVSFGHTNVSKQENTMASLHSQTPIAFPTLILLLFISFLTTILSQDPSSSSPSIAQCAPRLIPLTPCASFVQGTTQSPGPMCCTNLKQLYSQEPHCLCLLLNGTTLSSFPINTTLALELPALCSLQANISTCSGIKHRDAVL